MKVSICIPAYNQTNFLRNTLTSILEQEFVDYEIIVTDDSTDNSVENLTKQFDFKGRLKYFRNHEREGTPGNWNEAISFATGEYIKLMHHDDWFADSNSLNKFVALLDENPETDFAFSGCKNVNGNSVVEYSASYQYLKELKHNPYILILGNIIGAPSVTIYRRKAFTGFDTKLKWLVDFDQYIRMLEKNPNFTYTAEPLVNICNKSSHQVTSDSQNNIDVEMPEYIYLYDKYNCKFILDERYRKAIDFLYCKYGIRNLEDLTSLSLFSDIPAIFKDILSDSFFIKRWEHKIKTVTSKAFKKIKKV